jgi:histone H3/H4
MEITRPSITRLSRLAGVKSISEDCFDEIRDIMLHRLERVVKASLVVNSQKQNKTLMAEDVYDALALMGENLTASSYLGTSSITK